MTTDLDHARLIARRSLLKRAAATVVGLFAPACRRETAAPAPRPLQPTHSTLRIRLRHRNMADAEAFELMQLRAESAWSGLRIKGAAPDWGDYRLSAYDAAAGTLLHRAGFDSPADSAERAIAELSVRLPMPNVPIRAAIEKRRTGTVFREIWNAAIDPRSTDIDRSVPAVATRIDTLVSNGAPDSKVDIAILGDGYRDSDHAKFIADARRAAEYLFSAEPFSSRISAFNVHAAFAASTESGITDRYLDQDRNTVFRCAYGTGAAERTLAAGDEYALREAASTVPYDFVLVIANSRRYGGSAYFGGPAIAAIDSAAARYLVLHEFAHVIAGLAEEYYIPTDDGPAYAGNVEPWHPNVTTQAAKAKWRTLITGPVEQTRWNKPEYERHFRHYVERYYALRDRRASEATIERFLNEESARQAALLAKNTPVRRVGLFEGGHGYARGMFRAEVDCIMFSLQTRYFCRACAAAIERVIAAYTA